MPFTLHACAFAVASIFPAAAIFRQSQPRNIAMMEDVTIREDCKMCPHRPPQPSQKQKNVLIIGDSIYGPAQGAWPYIETNLTQQDVNVVLHDGPEGMAGYCASSAVWVRCAGSIVSSADWDVVTYNWGVHDIAPDMYTLMSIKEHKNNLRRVYATLKKNLKEDARIIFFSTTPTVKNRTTRECVCMGVTNDHVLAINQALAEVAAEFNPPIKVYDVYKPIVERCQQDKAHPNFPEKDRCPTIFDGPDVHMIEEGKQFFAGMIVDAVLSALA